MHVLVNEENISLLNFCVTIMTPWLLDQSKEDSERPQNNGLFCLFQAGESFCSLKANRDRMRRSFFPQVFQAINQNNTKNLDFFWTSLFNIHNTSTGYILHYICYIHCTNFCTTIAHTGHVCTSLIIVILLYHISASIYTNLYIFNTLPSFSHPYR